MWLGTNAFRSNLRLSVDTSSLTLGWAWALRFGRARIQTQLGVGRGCVQPQAGCGRDWMPQVRRGRERVQANLGVGHGRVQTQFEFGLG
jgi:hypothetical protein